MFCSVVQFLHLMDTNCVLPIMTVGKFSYLMQFFRSKCQHFHLQFFPIQLSSLAWIFMFLWEVRETLIKTLLWEMMDIQKHIWLNVYNKIQALEVTSFKWWTLSIYEHCSAVCQWYNMFILKEGAACCSTLVTTQISIATFISSLLLWEYYLMVLECI